MQAAAGQSTHHGRLRREELEGEVIGAIRQGIDLIRDPLHCEVSGGGQQRVAEESWRGGCGKSYRKLKALWRESSGGAGSIARDLEAPFSSRDHMLGSSTPKNGGLLDAILTPVLRSVTFRVELGLYYSHGSHVTSGDRAL